MKRIVILGSTGSIGRSALDVIAKHPDRFSVTGLAAGKNIGLLEEQVNAFSPDIVAVADEVAAKELRNRLGKKTEVLAGDNGINALAAYDKADFALSAMVGFSGLMPTLSAIKSGKNIGLANKEALVTAGDIVISEAIRNGVRILPVDSEHSAIFQCVAANDRKFLRRIILTASGGPFAGKTKDELKAVTPEEALKHPKWSMGEKITIDSATLMNKGLEVIEAAHLFGLTAGNIDVLIHPQSIVHSMAEFNDNSVLAQMSIPDMRGPIGYALSYPERLENTMQRLELGKIGSLTFSEPDTVNFPCLAYAYDALREGGTMPAVLNAANEAAVKAFLEKRIPFNSIPVIINKTMSSHNPEKAEDIGRIIEVDRWARELAERHIRNAH